MSTPKNITIRHDGKFTACDYNERNQFIDNTTINPTTFIRLMLDYSATCVWNLDGCNVELEQFYFSPSTTTLMTMWSEWYDSETSASISGEEPTEYNKCTKAQLKMLGELIFDRVCDELPGYTIIFENEE